ncbi:hypothetical protein HELRODRAFT_107348, partial [Helobdella robusta]|uniref:Histone-lysine N-methyltransferase n=1 Tax=Helobdella robusta TaxID=6412 RepID=T1EE98_HELRO
MTTTALKCNVNNCSFYYHVNCLKTLKYGKCEKRSLTCSHHTCASCAADAEKMGMAERGKMLKCIVCPNAYHTGDLCIAAGSRILSNGWIICGDHHQMSDNKRKHQEHVNVAWCFSCGEGGSLVCCENCPASFHPACCETPPSEEEKWICELCLDGKRPLYGEIVWCKAGIYRWWPGEICHPRNVPTNIQNIAHGIGDFPVRFFGSYDYLWTHKGRVFSFQEGDKKGAKRGSSKSFVEVFSKALDEADVAARIYYDERNKKDLKVYDKKPGPYKHVKSNVPIGKVEIFKVPLTEIPRCQCSPEMPSPCGPDSDCINRLMMYECDVAVCPAGEMCLNRAIQSRWDVDTEYFRTADNRGWGLRTKIDIKKGQFIHEYVGDLIDEEECKERLRRAKESNVTNFYMLTLDKNRIIDAGPKGNNSRFMNHSCQPNCETQKWNVNGDVRVGLFAMRFIEAGEELTFNYNFDCLGDKKTICHCGMPVCSGFLGERPKSTSTEAERTLITKKKKRRARNVTKDLIVHEDLCFRCGLGGELVLCDKTGCTKSYHLDCLNLNHLPRGKWICPWHLCNEENCGKWSSQLCSMCPNSFCSRHTEGNIIVLATGRIVCDDHPPSCPQLQYLLSKDWEELKSRD